MKKNDQVKLREQTEKELKARIVILQKEIMENKMQFSLGKLKDVHAMKKKKKTIAFIKTILKERELK